MPDDLDVLVDELFALPLDRFIAERDVLAKALRAEGRREDAARVAAQTKPSVVAWAVNQVVRAQRDAAAALWAAGDEVLATQERLVEGAVTGADLRAAIEAERRALAPLSDAARGLMTAAGKFLSEQHVQSVVETLHAAAIDRSARPVVAAGRLTRPLRLTGLEAALATGGRAPREAEASATRERISARERSDARDEAARRTAERERRAQREEARRALVRAERERDDARERIAAAVAARDEAAQAVERRRRELEAAETALTGAEEELAAAHDALERAEDAVDRARGEVERG